MIFAGYFNINDDKGEEERHRALSTTCDRPSTVRHGDMCFERTERLWAERLTGRDCPWQKLLHKLSERREFLGAATSGHLSGRQLGLPAGQDEHPMHA